METICDNWSALKGTFIKLKADEIQVFALEKIAGFLEKIGIEAKPNVIFSSLKENGTNNISASEIIPNSIMPMDLFIGVLYLFCSIISPKNIIFLNSNIGEKISQ